MANCPSSAYYIFHSIRLVTMAVFLNLLLLSFKIFILLFSCVFSLLIEAFVDKIKFTGGIKITKRTSENCWEGVNCTYCEVPVYYSTQLQIVPNPSGYRINDGMSANVYCKEVSF